MVFLWVNRNKYNFRKIIDCNNVTKNCYYIEIPKIKESLIFLLKY